jgi:hypothetical protein
MKIAAVKQSDIDRGVPQRARRVKAAEAAAKDNDAFSDVFSITNRATKLRTQLY